MGNESRAEKRTIEETIKYLKDLAEAFESQADEELKLNGDTGRYELLLGKSDSYGLAAFELERNMESAEEAHRRLSADDIKLDIRERWHWHVECSMGLSADEVAAFDMSDEELAEACRWMVNDQDCLLPYCDNLDLAIEHVKGEEIDCLMDKLEKADLSAPAAKDKTETTAGANAPAPVPEDEVPVQRTYSVEADCAHGSPADDWRTFAEDLLKWCDEPLDEQETQRQAAQMAARAVLLAGGRMAANAEG